MTTQDRKGPQALDDDSLDEAEGGAVDMFIKLKGVKGEPGQIFD